MSNIGWATMTVLPSAKGFGATLTKGLAPEMAAAGKASGDSFSKGMLKASAGLAAIALGVGIVATKMAADFQSATTLLVTGAGESEKSIKLVRDGLIAMAPAVGIGPTALAKAMFMVESAGYHGAAGLLVMKAAAEGAKIGGADATVVANGLTTALTDYHIPASRAAEVTSKLVATVAAGKTNMGDLTGSLSTILPFASSFGVSLNDVAGAMATMTGEGISADTTATMLKFTMMSMANETPKGRDALKSIGMTAQQLKNDLSSKGVGGALQAVTDQIAKKFPAGSVQATAALAAIVGGTRGMGSALALTGTHAKTLVANIKSISGASTEAGGHVRGWALTQEDFNTKMDQAKASVSAMAIKIGTALIPSVQALLADGVQLSTWLSKHTAVTWAIVGALGAFASISIAVKIASMAVAVAIKVATAATWLWTAALDGNPIGLVVIAIAALAAGAIYAYNHFKPFRDAVVNVWGALKIFGSEVASVGRVLITAFKTDGFSGFFSKLGSMISDAWPVIVKKLGEWGSAFVNWIGPKILPMLAELGKLYVALEKWIWLTALPAIGKKLLEWGKAFIEWIGPMIPPFLVELGKLEVKLGNWILLTALPTIYKKLREWGNAFWGWVPGAALGLIVEMGKLIARWDKWYVGTALPWLVKHLAEWALAFAKWVPGAVVGLIVEMGKLWARLSIWMLTTALPAIVVNLAKWAAAFLRWVTDVIVSLPGKLASLLGVIVSWAGTIRGAIVRGIGDLGTLLQQKGRDVIGGFLNGLTEIWHKVTAFIKSIAPWMLLNKGPVSLDAKLLVPAGHAIMNGFLDGLKAKYAHVTSFISGVAGSIGGALTNTAGIGGSGPISGTNQALGHQMMLAGGWGEGQWTALQALWTRESGWSTTAKNPGSGAYGIPQSYPANKMAAAGSDWQTNAMTQIDWGLGYIRDTYGSPIGAMVHENQFGWYANGTDSAAPGYAWVGERGPEIVKFNGGEKVIPNHQLGGANVVVNVHPSQGMDERQLADLVINRMDRALSGGMTMAGVS